MISDVPLGAFLSGGTDSSLITAIMQVLSPNKINTFTIGFHENKFSEIEAAKNVATYLGTEHNELYLSAKEAKELIATICTYFDEPFADSSQLPTMLVSKFARSLVTVALSGDGGDELFCGYKMYNTSLNYKKYKFIAQILNGANKMLGVKKILEKMGRKFVKLPYLTTDENIVNFAYMYSEQYLNGLVKNSPYVIDNRFFELMELTRNIQEKHMLQSMNLFLPDDILTKVDRSSMAVSLEARVPLLDYRIVEFSFNVPHALKVKDAKNKYLLKKLLNRYLPEKLIHRPKQGFSVPISDWLHGDLHYLLDTHLNKELINKQDMFDVTKIDEIKGGFEKSDAYFEEIIWHILVFQMWWKKYMA
jgi:asparagine synthase (glutamine-hydrolysing)